jgi:hypothetical protein
MVTRRQLMLGAAAAALLAHADPVSAGGLFLSTPTANPPPELPPAGGASPLNGIVLNLGNIQQAYLNYLHMSLDMTMAGQAYPPLLDNNGFPFGTLPANYAGTFGSGMPQVNSDGSAFSDDFVLDWVGQLSGAAGTSGFRLFNRTVAGPGNSGAPTYSGNAGVVSYTNGLFVGTSPGPTDTVTTSGTSVIGTNGYVNNNGATVVVGTWLYINGHAYQVATVSSQTSYTLTESAGNQSGVTAIFCQAGSVRFNFSQPPLPAVVTPQIAFLSTGNFALAQMRLYRYSQRANLPAQGTIPSTGAQLFNPDYLTLLKNMKPGALRFLDRMGQQINLQAMTSYRQRAPVSSFSFCTARWVPGSWAGGDTTNANDYVPNATPPNWSQVAGTVNTSGTTATVTSGLTAVAKNSFIWIGTPSGGKPYWITNVSGSTLTLLSSAGTQTGAVAILDGAAVHCFLSQMSTVSLPTLNVASSGAFPCGFQTGMNAPAGGWGANVTSADGINWTCNYGGLGNGVPAPVAHTVNSNNTTTVTISDGAPAATWFPVGSQVTIAGQIYMVGTTGLSGNTQFTVDRVVPTYSKVSAFTTCTVNVSGGTVTVTGGNYANPLVASNWVTIGGVLYQIASAAGNTFTCKVAPPDQTGSVMVRTVPTSINIDGTICQAQSYGNSPTDIFHFATTTNIGAKSNVWAVNNLNNPSAAGTGVIAPNGGKNYTFTFNARFGCWQIIQNGFQAHVPYELMVALCNAVNADFWWQAPLLLDDVSAADCAAYASANLNSGLKMLTEYCNENWNWAFNGPGYYGFWVGPWLFGNITNQNYTSLECGLGLRVRYIWDAVKIAWGARDPTQLVRLASWQAGDGGALNQWRPQFLEGTTPYAAYAGNVLSPGYTNSAGTRNSQYVASDFTVVGQRPVDFCDGISYATYLSGGAFRNGGPPDSDYVNDDRSFTCTGEIDLGNLNVLKVTSITSNALVEGACIKIGSFVANVVAQLTIDEAEPTGWGYRAGTYLLSASAGGAIASGTVTVAYRSMVPLLMASDMYAADIWGLGSLASSQGYALAIASNDLYYGTRNGKYPNPAPLGTIAGWLSSVAGGPIPLYATIANYYNGAPTNRAKPLQIHQYEGGYQVTHPVSGPSGSPRLSITINQMVGTTTMVVTAVSGGLLLPGQYLPASAGFPGGCYVVSQKSGSTGGVGSYTISLGASMQAGTYTGFVTLSHGASMTVNINAIAGSRTMVVNSVTSGSGTSLLTYGQTMPPSYGFPPNTYVVGQTAGTPGGAGTYKLNNASTVAGGSFVANTQDSQFFTKTRDLIEAFKNSNKYRDAMVDFWRKFVAYDPSSIRPSFYTLQPGSSWSVDWYTDPTLGNSAGVDEVLYATPTPKRYKIYDAIVAFDSS